MQSDTTYSVDLGIGPRYLVSDVGVLRPVGGLPCRAFIFPWGA